MQTSRFSIIIDVETSGNDPVRNGVIAIAALLIDENENIKSSFFSLVRPPDLSRGTWSLDAAAVHGISYNEIENATPNRDAMLKFLFWLAPYREPGKKFNFICHANPAGWFDPITKNWKIIKWFDYFFIEHAMRKEFDDFGANFMFSFLKVCGPNNLISTVQMGRAAGYKKNDLATWGQRLNLPLNHHDPISDVKCCLEVYKFLKYNNNLNFQPEQKTILTTRNNNA